MAGKRGRLGGGAWERGPGRAGAAAAVAERIQGDPCKELGQGSANGATPDSDKREARLARDAENK
eukprot:53862-Hanusia_phi.AAC.1